MNTIDNNVSQTNELSNPKRLNRFTRFTAVFVMLALFVSVASEVEAQINLTGGSRLSSGFTSADNADATHSISDSGSGVDGNIEFGSGADTLTVNTPVSDGASEAVEGDISFGGGNDRLILRSGELTGLYFSSGNTNSRGTIDFGAGTDRLDMSRASASASAIFGNIIGLEALNISSGTVSGNINSSSADATYTVSGFAEVWGNIVFDSGDDTLTVTGTPDDVFDTIVGNLTFGEGDDTLNWRSGGLGHSDFDPSNSLYRATYEINFGAGIDILNLSGDSEIDANITGLETLNMSGGTLNGNISSSSAAATYTISGTSGVEGGLLFGSGDDTLTVNAVYDDAIGGDITFGVGDDTLNWSSGGLVGSIDFGTDDDTFNLSGGTIFGSITNLETLNKTGSGVALLDNDVTFQGSTAANIQGGELQITGHLNVGSSGTVTINNGARITGILSGSNMPKITAGMLSFSGAPQLHLAPSATDVNVAPSYLQSAANGFIADQTRITTGGTDALTVAFVSQSETTLATQSLSSGMKVSSMMATLSAGLTTSAKIAAVLPVANIPTSSSGGGGGGGGAALAGIGVLAALWYLDVFPSSFTDQAYGDIYDINGWNYTNSQTNGAVRYWGRAASADDYTLGADVGFGNGFSLGFAATPQVNATSTLLPNASLDGERYSVRGDWRGEQLFANAEFTRGDYNGHAQFYSPQVDERMNGGMKLDQEQLQLGLGARWKLAGIETTPYASVFSGKMTHGAHRANGAVFYADIPEVKQRYDGWKLGLNLATGWNKTGATTHWRPSLRLAAIGTDTAGAASVNVRQADRLGALSLTDSARVGSSPSTVYAVGAGLDAYQKKNWRLRFGYASLEVDGKTDHAVAAQFQIPLYGVGQ